MRVSPLITGDYGVNLETYEKMETFAPSIQLVEQLALKDTNKVTNGKNP